MKTHYCVVLDQEGQTPLHIAASAGHIQLVDALIQAGCDVTVQDFVSSIFFLIEGRSERSERRPFLTLKLVVYSHIEIS